MIALQNKDGTTIEIELSEGDRQKMVEAGAIAKGWAFGRMVTQPMFQPLDTDAPKPAKQPRKPPACFVMEPAVERTILEWFAPGKSATKRAFVDDTGMASDLASQAIDLLVEAGKLVKATPKTYRAAMPPEKATP